MPKTTARTPTKCPSCEILSPEGVAPKGFITPSGPEVLMLLSGKMRMQVQPETVIQMQFGCPVVVEKPYCLFCPDGTGRVLRVQVPPADLKSGMTWGDPARI